MWRESNELTIATEFRQLSTICKKVRLTAHQPDAPVDRDTSKNSNCTRSWLTDREIESQVQRQGDCRTVTAARGWVEYTLGVSFEPAAGRSGTRRQSSSAWPVEASSIPRGTETCDTLVRYRTSHVHETQAINWRYKHLHSLAGYSASQYKNKKT